MKNTLRAFIAIELNHALRLELVRAQNELRKSDADIKWVEPDNIHLTLKFLGDTPVEKVAAVKATLEKTAVAFPVFMIELAGLGAFPNASHPKVIWAGLKEKPETLASLVADLENALAGLGCPKETRPFSAHITLGRVRSFRRKERLNEALRTVNLSDGSSQKVEKLKLFQSQLTSEGPMYSVLGEGKLKEQQP